MLAALERYEALRHLGIRELDVSRIQLVRVTSLSRYATTGCAPTIARMPAERRIATLVAFNS
jgi:hypothetical protein